MTAADPVPPAHEKCPGSWCWIIACEQCGEMLTNPKPKDEGWTGICQSHGRLAAGVLMRREDCLVPAADPVPVPQPPGDEDGTFEERLKENLMEATTTLRPYRDVLADRIEEWAGDAGVYDFVDRLLSDLDRAGYEVTPSSCLDPGCTRELGAFCEDHGYVLYGRTEADVDSQGNPAPGKPRMAELSFREDIAMVLTVYDEHVALENRGPWRDRLAAWVEAAT